MRQRVLIALIAAAVAVVALAAVVVSRGNRAVSEAAPGQRALPGFADRLDHLAALRLTRGNVTVNLRNGGRAWTIAEKGDYPADQARVRGLLLRLAELELIEPKTDKPGLLPRLDLDDPANGKSTEITATDRNGAVAGRIIIGRGRPSDITAGEAGVYVRQPGSDQAWLARGSFNLGGDAIAWLDRRIIDIPPARVASVVLTGADGAAAIVARASADLPLALDSVPADLRPRPDAVLAAPAGALNELELTDVKPISDPQAVGSGGTTAAVTTFDGLVVGLRLTPPEAGDWLTITATGDGNAATEAAALNARLSHWRFAIPAARAKLLRTTLADLVLPRGS